MSKIYKKEKRKLRHFLEATFNLYTRKMSLKKLKFFYQEFLSINEYINRINNTNTKIKHYEKQRQRT